MPSSLDLTIELRSANGSCMEWFQSEAERIRETLRALASPQLFAQHHLLLASSGRASMIPCKGIDMILARTWARSPVRFPLNLPMGQFDIVEQPEDGPAWGKAAKDNPTEEGRGQPRQRSLRVEVHTLGGWSVTLKAVAMIRGNPQDERQLFAHLPNLPTLPFRLEEGGFGLINTANIVRATAWPKPEALPGMALPLELRWCIPSPLSNSDSHAKIVEP